MEKTRKRWHLLLHKFWLLLPKIDFLRVDWALACVPNQFRDFPGCIGLNIEFSFTCSKSNFHENAVKCNIYYRDNCRSKSLVWGHSGNVTVDSFKNSFSCFFVDGSFSKFSKHSFSDYFWKTNAVTKLFIPYTQIMYLQLAKSAVRHIMGNDVSLAQFIVTKRKLIYVNTMSLGRTVLTIEQKWLSFSRVSKSWY